MSGKLQTLRVLQGQEVHADGLLGDQRALAERYDRVISGTPPINFWADAGSLASLVSSVVLVVRDGGCAGSELAAVVARVKSASGSLGGVVLNHVCTPILGYGNRRYEAYGADDTAG